MRRLLAAAAVALLIAPAAAQTPQTGGSSNQSNLALIAPTAPAGDSSNRIANTAWVNGLIDSGMVLPSGKIWIGSVGNIATPQTPSGDLTVSTAGVFTFGAVNANVGTFGSTTDCVTITVNAKGLVTAASQAACAGGGGTPGGSSGQVQYNNAGAFGGFTVGGDATLNTGTGALTLASTIAAAGPIGSATVAPIITYDAKGRLTTVTSATITPAIGSITGLAAGCANWLATATSANLRSCMTDESGTGVLYFQGGDIGTPSAGVGTNLTALNASNLSSGTVAAARGGAGTITGALRGNGSGVVTQAACSDLSNGTALCSTTPGAGVATAAAANLSAAGGLTSTIASGTSAMGTGAISSATCATVVTTAATNTATTDVVLAGFNGDPTAVTGYVPLTAGMLTIIAYPTANNVNFKVCNNTSSSITPGAITLNWRVLR